MGKKDLYERVMSLAMRRGFLWPSYEVYGGVGGFVDFGPLGAPLKHRIEEKWRALFVAKQGFHEVETPIVAPERVFEASGHLQHFKEPVVQCKACSRKYRADHLLQEFVGLKSMEAEKLSLNELETVIETKGVRCPECSGELSKPTVFLTMFTTTIGPYSDAVGYLRPEAAQGMFTAFKRVYELERGKLPVGVAQVGKASRNEVSPRQLPIRLREFTIMELELFFDPLEPQCPRLEEVGHEVLSIIPADMRTKGLEEPIEVSAIEAVEEEYVLLEWLAYFMALAKRLLAELGVPNEKQRFIEKLPWERAHYSAQGFDQEVFLERWGWVEVSGHNYRTDYDLRGHMEESGVDMRVFKLYGKPVKTEKLVVKPIAKAIGPAFKEKVGEVLEALEGVKPEALAKAFQEQGYYMVEGFKITPDHVEVEREIIEERGRRFIPHVVEPSFGADRLFYIVLENAYRERKGRVVMEIPRNLVPIQLAVLPLVRKDGLPEKAREIHSNLVAEGFACLYDEAGSIGRRYVRLDEMGVPIVITVDYETLKDGTVTLRDRASWKQVRTKLMGFEDRLRDYLYGREGFQQLGFARDIK